MPSSEQTPEQAWAAFVDGLRIAGEHVAQQTAELSEVERADAYRALLRGLNNQLGRFEVDRERPELVFFNGWREKMFMDNPDFRYWVADIRDDGRYRITGSVGDAAYVSITAYSSSGTLDASAGSRLDSDSLTLDSTGSFSVVLSGEDPADGSDWMALPDGASSVWMRHFHRDVRNDELGRCSIEPIGDVAPPPTIVPKRFTRHLARLGRGIESFPAVWEAAAERDRRQPNAVRHWTEMAGGAAFTEPDIHYLRGSWQLGSDEALVIEGDPVPCRYWNAILYSRFLNTLDHRCRNVSCTDGTVDLVDGRYRLIVAGRDPGGPGNWLDTEGREFGIFALRFLQPESEVQLPDVRVMPLSEIGGA